MTLRWFNPSAAGRALSLGATAAFLAIATACGGGGQPGPADPAVQRGKAVYDRVCATCHGTNARGMPRLGKDLHNNAYTKGLSDDELVEFLKKGRSATHELNETGVEMPPKGGDPNITDEDLRGVVAYLRTLP